MVSIWLTRIKGSCFPLMLSCGMKKIGLAGRDRFSSNSMNGSDRYCRLLAILLNAGGAQAGEAMLVDRELPGEELVHGQSIAAAGLFEGEEAASHSGNDFGLAANDPTFGPGRGQVRNGQRAAGGPDDVFHPRAMGFCHGVLTNS